MCSNVNLNKSPSYSLHVEEAILSSLQPISVPSLPPILVSSKQEDRPRFLVPSPKFLPVVVAPSTSNTPTMRIQVSSSSISPESSGGILVSRYQNLTKEKKQLWLKTAEDKISKQTLKKNPFIKDGVAPLLFIQKEYENEYKIKEQELLKRKRGKPFNKDILDNFFKEIEGLDTLNDIIQKIEKRIIDIENNYSQRKRREGEKKDIDLYHFIKNNHPNILTATTIKDIKSLKQDSLLPISFCELSEEDKHLYMKKVIRAQKENNLTGGEKVWESLALLFFVSEKLSKIYEDNSQDSKKGRGRPNEVPTLMTETIEELRHLQTDEEKIKVIKKREKKFRTNKSAAHSRERIKKIQQIISKIQAKEGTEFIEKVQREMLEVRKAPKKGPEGSSPQERTKKLEEVIENIKSKKNKK